MDDALKRSLGKRDRAKVQPRDQSLTPIEYTKPENEEAKTPSFPPVEVSSSQDTSTQRSLHKKKPILNEIQTKQTTMRLEQSISDLLQQICREHNVSREVLIEALLKEFDGNKQIQRSVLTEAQSRHDQRMQLANRKRAQTMIEKFGTI